MRRAARLSVALLGLCCAQAPLRAQSAASPPTAPPKAMPAAAPVTGRTRLVEIADFSRYVDGRYIGHAWREARGWLEPSGPGFLAGEYLILGETSRDQRLVAAAVDRAGSLRVPAGGLPAAAGPGGARVEDPGFPSYRGVPAFPAQPLPAGQSWTAPATFCLDPRGTGAALRVSILVEYRDEGSAQGPGGSVRKLWARFALRHRGLPGEDVAAVTGSHVLQIQLDGESGAPRLINDSFDETITWASGGTERRKGFLLSFFEGSLPRDRGAEALAMRDAVQGTERPAAGLAPVAAARAPDPASSAPAAPAHSAPVATTTTTIPVAPAPEGLRSAGSGPLLAAQEGLAAAGLELDESPLGLVLRAADLRFKADSDELLPAEKARLDAISAALRAAYDAGRGRNFLVEGHAAATGKPAGELELSGRRAKRVVDELVARGLPAAAFVWRGLGSTIPLAANDSEAGKARNRRVEITILE